MNSIKTYAGSAITVLNAVKSTHGAAIGIEIPISVEIQTSKSLSFEISPAGIKPTLLLACIELMNKKLNKEIDKVRIVTNSPLLPEKGLKTSSAISCAVISGLAKYFNEPLSLKEIVLMSAEASINAGVSITGAIDDAYSSFCGGLAYTENKSMKLISLKNYNTKSRALLLIPRKANAKMDVKHRLLDIDLNLIKSAHQNFQRGNVILAIKDNTKAYGQLLLDDYAIIDDMNRFKPKVIGLNGTGPSLFALCEREKLNEFRKNISENFTDYMQIDAPIKKMVVMKQ